LRGDRLPVQNHGEATRDFIFVTDICQGLIACAINGIDGGVYNLASGCERSILDLATSINEITGNRAGIEYLPRRPWDHSGRRFGSTDKAERELGFNAKVGLEEGLQSTVKWTRENLSRIDACIAKHARFMNGAQMG
jgi:UDP-glucose 4-epimerase